MSMMDNLDDCPNCGRSLMYCPCSAPRAVLALVPLVVAQPLTEQEIAESTLAADRAQWIAFNFDGTKEHCEEALEKLLAYAKLIRDLLAAHGIGGHQP